MIFFEKVVRCYSYNTKYFSNLYYILFNLFYSPVIDHISKASNKPVIFFDTTPTKDRCDYIVIADNFYSKLVNDGVSCERFIVYNKLSILELFKKIRMVLGDGSSEPLIYKVVRANYSIFSDSYIIPILDLGYRLQVCTFCDAHPLDNYIAQFCNNKSLSTYTLQHGFYKECSGINSEVYSNFVSNYMLIWGEATYKELTGLGISKERLIITGSFKPNLPLYEKRAKKNLVILLNGRHQSLINQRLINLSGALTKRGYVVSVRSHPDDNLSKYSFPKGVIKCSSQQPFYEVVKNYDVFIACGTGLVYDLLTRGYTVYVLNGEEFGSEKIVETVSFEHFYENFDNGKKASLLIEVFRSPLVNLNQVFC